MRDGLGMFLHADGTEEQGIWSQGQLIKEQEISPSKAKVTPSGETLDGNESEEYSVRGEWARNQENQKIKNQKTN